MISDKYQNLTCQHIMKKDIKIVVCSSHYQYFLLQYLSDLFASEEFCRLLLTFANNLDPDQDGHFVCPDLDPNHLTFSHSDRVPEEFFEKVNF